MLVISVSVLPPPPESSLFYIPMVYPNCSHVAVSYICRLALGLLRVGDIPVTQLSIHFFISCSFVVVCNGWFVFPLIFLKSCALLSFALWSTGII